MLLIFMLLHTDELFFFFVIFAAFVVLSLSLTFSNVTMMCLGFDLFNLFYLKFIELIDM